MIIVVPTRGGGPSLTPKWVHNSYGLIKPMNQNVFGPVFIPGREIGDAYETMAMSILSHPVFSGCKYLLTWEDDVLPPQDGLLRLIESIEGGVDGVKYDVMQGLYWTKGLEGVPMIYGDIQDPILNYRPQPPIKGKVVRSYGLGMGFNLFRMSMLRDPKFPRPMFHTMQGSSPDPEQGKGMLTQDMYFYRTAHGLGYKFGCDCRVLMGHYSHEEDRVW